MHSSSDGIALGDREDVENSHISGPRPALTRCAARSYTPLAYRRASCECGL